MASSDIFRAIEFLKEAGEPALRRFVRAHRGATHAEMRFEVVFSRTAVANNGTPRDSAESENAAFGVAVYCADRDAIIGHGQTGVEIGRIALSTDKLMRALRIALAEAYERARASACEKAALLKVHGAKARSLTL